MARLEFCSGRNWVPLHCHYSLVHTVVRINPGSNTPRNNSCEAIYFLSQNHPSKTNKTCGTLLEKQGWTHNWCSSMGPYKWTFQCRATGKNLQQFCIEQDVIWKNYRKRWTIEMDVDKESKNPRCQRDLMLMRMDQANLFIIRKEYLK